ncbi:calcium-binding protein [Pseudaestuariivita rosea]|uniref:calcium-binding protein n=1 Tax=Pseudaestuariivita rosea TaxID=2763263 RepID=UPI001ABA9BF8|nr:calcium-binding protein [Pseudaestuariivita rosea]
MISALPFYGGESFNEEISDIGDLFTANPGTGASLFGAAYAHFTGGRIEDYLNAPGYTILDISNGQIVIDSEGRNVANFISSDFLLEANAAIGNAVLGGNNPQTIYDLMGGVGDPNGLGDPVTPEYREARLNFLQYSDGAYNGDNNPASYPNVTDPVVRISQTATNERDLLMLTGGDDFIDAMGGDDLVLGGHGSDQMSGGAGDDALWGQTGNDFLFGADGADYVRGGLGNDVVIGGLGNDVLDGGDISTQPIDENYDNSLWGWLSGKSVTDGRDLLYGNDGDDLIRGGSGIDDLHGGDGNDHLIGGSGADLMFDSGADRPFQQGDDPAEYEESLFGYNAGNDTLDGGSGADALVYTGGTDTFIGGTGDDSYLSFSTSVQNASTDILTIVLSEDPNDETTYFGHDTIVGSGQGIGQVVFEGLNRKDVEVRFHIHETTQLDEFTLEYQSIFGHLIGTSGFDPLDYPLYQVVGSIEIIVNDTRSSLYIEQVSGSYIGGANHPGGSIYVQPQIYSPFNIVFDDQTVHEWNRFVDWNDLGTAFISETLTDTADAAAESSTEERADIPDDLPPEMVGDENANSFVGLNTSDRVSALGGDDSISLGAGDDFVEGGAGADTLDGGAGVDTAIYASAGFRVHVSLKSGTGMIADAYGDVLIGIENVIGSNFDDILEGSDAVNNVLSGGAGNDHLRGGISNDTLIGGAGDDRIISGGGLWLEDNVVTNNVIDGGDGDDYIEGNVGDDFIEGGAGNDRILGRGGNDTIYGNDGNDQITSGVDEGGRSLFYGGAGDDYLFVRTFKTDHQIHGGAGNDTFLVVVPGGEVFLTEIDLSTGRINKDTGRMSGIENVIGGNGNDTITGNDQDNLLDGHRSGSSLNSNNIGHDILNGGGGNDTLLGRDAEDTLNGGAGDDLLDGGTGGDLLRGGDGIDTAVFEEAYGDLSFERTENAILITNAAGDVDQVFNDVETLAFTDQTLSFSEMFDSLPVPVLALDDDAGTIDEDAELIFNPLENDLRPDGTTLTITAIDGQAIAVGGIVTLASGVSIELLDDGRLRVLQNDAFQALNLGDTGTLEFTYTISAQGDTSQATISATINGLDEPIYGTDQNDTLNGTDGNDIIVGGLGDDTLNGGTGSDTYVYALGDGSDLIMDYQFGSHTADRLVLNGITPDDVTVSRSGNNAIMTMPDGGSITLVDALRDDWYIIETIEFADGTIWDHAAMRNQMVSDMKATGTVVGTGWAETYVHTSGDGSYTIQETGYANDQLVFTDLNVGDVQFSHNAGNDLVMTTVGGEVITVTDHFNSFFDVEDIEEIRFADGTVLDLDGIRAKSIADQKDSGFVRGSRNTDVYQHAAGDGSYTIQETGNANDQLVFTDLTVDDVQFSHSSGGDLVMTTVGGEVITVWDHFANISEDIEEIRFADGTVLDLDGIRAKSIADQKATGFVRGTHLSETYFHTSGDGSYTILEFGASNDQFVFTDLNLGDVRFTKSSGGDMVMTTVGGEVITVWDHFVNSSEDIEEIVFADGTVLDLAGIEANLSGPPTAVDDVASVAEGAVLEIDVLSNDTDADGDPLTVTQVAGQAISAGQSVTLVSGAIVTLLANGQLQFDQNGAYDSLNDSDSAIETIAYTISDGQGGTSTAELAVTIAGEGVAANGTPVAVDDAVTVAEEAVVDIDVLSNDSDADGDPLTITQLAGQAISAGQSVTLASGAIVTLLANGQLQFDQNGAYESLNDGDSALETIAYTISDGQGGTSTANLAVSITGATDGTVDPGPYPLIGGPGDDTLAGTAGDDTLSGGNGSDTYLFAAGDGQDVIDDNGWLDTDVLAISGYTTDQLTLSDGGNNRLLISFAGTTDSITINGMLNNDGYDRIEEIRFEDGTVWNTAEIAAQLIAGQATAGDDIVVGTTLEDTVYGAAGNDTLSGGNGSDTYLFAAGDGQDVIDDNGWKDTDVLSISGYTTDQLTLSDGGNNRLLISFAGTTDSITINGMLNNDGYDRIEEIRFEDGTVWDTTEINAQLLADQSVGGATLIDSPEIAASTLSSHDAGLSVQDDASTDEIILKPVETDICIMDGTPGLVDFDPLICVMPVPDRDKDEKPAPETIIDVSNPDVFIFEDNNGW